MEIIEDSPMPDGSVNHETTFLINPNDKKQRSVTTYNVEKKSCVAKLSGKIRGWMIFVVLLNAILVGCYMIFFFLQHDLFWGTLSAHTWILFTIITFNSYVVIRIATHFVKLLLEALFFTSVFFFYVSELGWPAAVLIWDFFWWFLIQPSVLKPVDSRTYYHLEQIFWIFLTISVVFIIKSTLAQFVIGRFNKANFWKKVRKAMFKERVLQVLLHGQARVQNTVSYDEIKKRYSGITPSFSLADLQQNIAINAKLKSLRKSSSLGFLPAKKKSVSAFEREIGQTTDVIFRNLRNVAKNLNSQNSVLLEQNEAQEKERVTIDEFKQYFSDSITLAKAFSLFKIHDRANDNTLTRDDIESAVRILLRDRKILAKTLQNRQSISGIIITTMGTLAWIAIVIISLWILDVNYISSLVPLGTALLALSFVFGNSVKNAFEAFLFLFFVKAYDVGDRMGIDGETVIISKINLLSTYAYTTDGRKIIIPTRKLSEATLINYQRSRNHVVNLTLVVDPQVPSASLDELKKVIQKFITDRREVYCPELYFAFKSIDEQIKLQIDVAVELNGITWSSATKYLNARSELVRVIKDTSMALKIKGPKAQLAVEVSESLEINNKMVVGVGSD